MRCNHIHRRNNRCYRPRQWVPPQPYVYMDSVGEISAQVWPFSPHTQTSSSEFIIPYSPSNADNPLWEIATDTSDITIASMMIDWASDGEISFTINAWEEWTATLSYWAVNNPEDVKTIEVTVWTPTPVTPIPNNNILIEPTRWNAIVKFFAIDETSEDYVEASVGWVELENISYHWACEWNEYCQGMFSNRTLVRYLWRALSDYIDEYWIPADWVLYFSEEVYDSVEDYFAWEITAAQLGRNIRDAEQAIASDDPSLPFTITSVDADSISITVWTSEQFWLNYAPSSANPKKHIIITSTDDSIATAHIDDYSDWRARIWFDWIGVWVATVTLSDWVNNYDVEVTVEELPCVDPCNPECPNYNPCECDPCSQDCPDRDPCACDWECEDCPAYITEIDTSEFVVEEWGASDLTYTDTRDCSTPIYDGWSAWSDEDNIAWVQLLTDISALNIWWVSRWETEVHISDGSNTYDIPVRVRASWIPVESVSFPELEDYGEGYWWWEAYYDSETWYQNFDTILEYSPEWAAYQNLIFSWDEWWDWLDWSEDGEGVPHIYWRFNWTNYANIDVFDESGTLLANLGISADVSTPIQWLYFDDQKTETETNITMSENDWWYINENIDVWFEPSWIEDPSGVLKITSDNSLPYDFWVTTECPEGGCPEDGFISLELPNDPEYYSITSDTVRIFDINADEQVDSPLAILNVTIEWPQEEPCLEWSQSLNPQFNPWTATLFFYACDTENLDWVAINDDTWAGYSLDIMNDYDYDASTNCYAYVSDLPKWNYTFEIHSLGSTIATTWYIETNCDMYPCSDPDCPGYAKCGNANFIEAYNPNWQGGSISMKVMYEDWTDNYVSITWDSFMPTIELSWKYEWNEDIYWMFNPEWANITAFMMESTEHCDGWPEGNMPCYYEFTDEARNGISEFISTGNRDAFVSFIMNMEPNWWIVPARIHNRIVCYGIDPDPSFTMSEASDDEGNWWGILWQIWNWDHVESNIGGELAQNPGVSLLQTVLDGLTVQEFYTIMAWCEEWVMYKLIPAIFDKMVEILTSEPDAGMQDEAQALLATLQGYAQRGESILLDPNGWDDPEEPSYLEFQQTTDEWNWYIENNSNMESAVLLNILEPYTPYSSSDIVLDPHRTEDFSWTIQTARIDQNWDAEYPFRIVVRMGSWNYNQLANGTKIATIWISSSWWDYLWMVDVYKNCYNCQ